MNRLEELKVVELGEKIGYKKGFEAARKQFERPHGEWIKKGEIFWTYNCSLCGDIARNDYRSRFCPNCGASMAKEGEAE